MEGKTKRYNEKLFQTGRMYSDICYASCYGNQWGSLVKELRKKYNLRMRDIRNFVEFMLAYDSYDGRSFSYSIYRFWKNEEIPDANIPFESLESYEEILDEKEIDDDCFIRIVDDIIILQEKIAGLDINVTNASFVKRIREEVYSTWNRISDAKLNPEYIVNKKDEKNIPEHLVKSKKEWIEAAINCFQAVMQYRVGGGTKFYQKKVWPLGLYYDKFLQKYYCVYTLDYEECLEIELEDIFKISVQNQIGDMNFAFHIDEYIKKNQTEQMSLKVFHEAKVSQKLKTMLDENQLEVTEGKDYDIFTFRTDDPWQYLRIINGFGKSVIVEEPYYIREGVLDTTREALSYYERGNSVLV